MGLRSRGKKNQIDIVGPMQLCKADQIPKRSEIKGFNIQAYVALLYGRGKSQVQEWTL